MRRPAVCLALILWFAPALAAEEPTKEEERFLKELVEALEAESEPVRRAAEEALVAMGDRAAAWLVPNMRRVDRDATDAAVRVLIRLGYSSVVRIRALEKLPSGRAGDALSEVVDALGGGGGIAGFGDPDPAVVARVGEIMDGLPSDFFSSDAEAVGELVDLGRSAIPALLPYLSPARGFSPDFEDSAAAAALGRICGPRDTMRLATLLDQGWTKIASVFETMDDPACVPALIRALEENHMSHDVGSALEHFRDPRTRRPIVDFLEKHGDVYPSGTMSLLDLLVEFRAVEAIPVVKRIAKSDGDMNLERNAKIVNCSRALVRLGDPAGIPPLIGALTLSGHDEWLVNWAGRTLNAVTGQNFWQEGTDGSEARKRYEEWYADAKGRLVWNPSMMQFRIAD